MRGIIKGATGKERPSLLNFDDVARVHDALAAMALYKPPAVDGDVPF
jgi:hypothetical protein